MQAIDCDKLETIPYTLNLSGRQMLVIFNALALYSQNELPNICSDCENCLMQLLPMIEKKLEEAHVRTKNLGEV